MTIMAETSHTDDEMYCLHCGVWVVPRIEQGWSGVECPRCSTVDLLHVHECDAYGVPA